MKFFPKIQIDSACVEWKAFPDVTFTRSHASEGANC